MRRCLLLIPAILVSDVARAQTRATVAALPPEQVGARGASVPFVEYEAENAVTSGNLLGPDRTFGTMPSEASGRRAIKLDRTGDYGEFTLGRPANAITVRYAVPDSIDGRGIESSLGVYAGGSGSARSAPPRDTAGSTALTRSATDLPTARPTISTMRRGFC